MLCWQNPGRHQLRMMETLNIVFAQESDLLKFLFESDCPKLRHSSETLLLLSGGFSESQQILVRVALDLWSGSGDVRMWQIIENIDDENYFNVLSGLQNLRRIDDAGPEMRWCQPKMAY